MKTVAAIYENGLFRPLEEIDLPESATVEIRVPSRPPANVRPELAAVYEVLARRHQSEVTDGAARHDEHQP